MLNQLRDTLVTSLNNLIQGVIYFVPKFITGLIILLIGIILASVVKQAIISISQSIKLEAMLRRYGVPEMKNEYSWTNILAEIGRWFVIILFLLPTADVWGLPRIGALLNQLLLYLPNVLVSVIIAIVGFAVAKLAYNLILASAKGVSQDTAITVASVAQWAIYVFVVLAVLNQLGVASDLIRILFTGIVAMVALAGGISFGLGGQDSARDFLHAIRKRLK